MHTQTWRALAFLLWLTAAGFFRAEAIAAVPQKINYQGFVTDAANLPISATVSMTLKIYNVPSGGSALFTEVQSVTLANGVFNVAIGAVTSLTLPFDVPYFLGVTISPDAEMTPRQALASSPYALQSGSALGLASGVTIGASQIANGAISSAKLASGAVGPASLSTTGCTTGDTLIFDGTTWSCARAPVPRPQLKQTDLQANAGKFSSVAIGIDGLPLVAYYEQASKVLRVAHCETIECDSATLSTIDSAGDVGQYVSLTISSTGPGVMSYYDATNQALKIAFCADVRCSSATVQTVDSNNDVGRYSSITLSSINNPWISYYDATLKDLKVAQCNGASTCNSPTIVTPVATGNVGEWTAITFSPAGTFVIAYYDATAHLVRIATCVTIGSCASPTLVTVDSLATNVAEGIAITTANNGAPVLSYVSRVAAGSGTRRIAICDDVNCATPAIVSLGAVGANLPQTNTAVTIGADGFPAAVFSPAIGVDGNCEAANTSSGNSFFKCLDALCSSTTATGLLGISSAPSLTIGVDGMPIVSTWHCSSTPAGTGVRVQHCANPNCAGPFRRR